MNRRIRGRILELVRSCGPEGISIPVIEKTFRLAGKIGWTETLEENLVYLSDKGYLRRDLVRDSLTGVKRWMAYVTPRGIDLMEGTIEADPGVTLSE